MPKSPKYSTKKRSPKAKPSRSTTIKPSQPTVVHTASGKMGESSSKQARVITMLQSPAGTTIAAMMKATGWQQHSVRGFLAGVIRKKLNLKLQSIEVDGNRIYRIGDEAPPKTSGSKSKGRAV